MAPRLRLPCEPSSSCCRSISRSCHGLCRNSPPLPAAPTVSRPRRGYSHVSKCMRFTGDWRRDASAADNTPSSTTISSAFASTLSRWAAPTAASRPSAFPKEQPQPATRPTRGSGPSTRPRTLSNQAAAVDGSVASPEGAVCPAGDSGTASDPRVVVVYDLSDQVIEYEQAWAWQRALLERSSTAAVAGGAARRGAPRHSLLLLQHPPVYTLGAGSTTDNLRFPPGQPPIPLYRTERGGEVTYHGPGQLVMYPILDLQALKPDLHWYLRQLEQVVIEALDSVSGLQGERLEGLTGVWVDGAKVAAIGVRAKRWVSYHGLALNVVTDLAPFSRIVPCGIADRAVTSVARLLEARAAAEDPFAPPAAASAAVAEGAGGGGGSGMIPLAEATQEDLRAMLASTGMSPLVVEEARATGAGARTPGFELDMDDPFAPPLASPSASASQAPWEPAAAATPAAAVFNGGGGAAAAGVGEELRVRSVWSGGERLLLAEYGCALLESFSEVFGLELTAGDPAELAGM